MKPLLYRGKRQFNGEWIQGILMSLNNVDFSIVTFKPHAPKIGCPYMIEPETRSEYIGRHDQNKELIWEGDILQYTAHESCILETQMLIVTWSEDLACWGYLSSLSLFPGEVILPFSSFDELQFDLLDHCTRIGNIWDNKELAETILRTKPPYEKP